MMIAAMGLAALFVLPTAGAPAFADGPTHAHVLSGGDTDDDVSIDVKGKGLHVDSVTITSSKQRNGEAFQVYKHTGGDSTESNVTGWKQAKFVNVNGARWAEASWKLNRSFPNRTWLCAVSKRSSGNPCIKVHG